MPPELKSKKKRVKELIDRVRNKNSDNKNETKLTNTAEKQLEQANKGPEEKKKLF